MELLSLTVDSRTAVPVVGELPGGGAVVLLGMNSRGKSTVLESLATHIGHHIGELREWPSYRPRPDARVEARFAISDTDRPALQGLLEVFQTKCVIHDSAYRRGGPRLVSGEDPEVTALGLETIVESGLLTVDLGEETKVYAGSGRIYLGWVDPYVLRPMAPTIAVGTDVPDPSVLLESVIEDVLDSWFEYGYTGIPDAARRETRAGTPPADPWMDTLHEEHHVYAGIVALLEAVEGLVNRWVPRFVTETGRLRCRLLPMES